METPAKNFSFYEDAKAFDDFHKYTSYYQACQRYLVDMVQAKPDNLVLEIGCATGETTRAVSRRYPQSTILGIDFRDSIIQEAQRISPQSAYPNLHFQAADMTQISNYIPWKGRYPDVLCSLFSFHHVPDPIERKFDFAKELYELPQDNMRVVIVDVVTTTATNSPEFQQNVMEEWNKIAQEAYNSVLLNRYIELTADGVPSEEAYETAVMAASYTRDVELTIAPNVAIRNDEYVVSDKELLEIWLDAGFHTEFHGWIEQDLFYILVLKK